MKFNVIVTCWYRFGGKYPSWYDSGMQCEVIRPGEGKPLLVPDNQLGPFLQSASHLLELRNWFWGCVLAHGVLGFLLIFRLLKRFGLWLVWSLKCTPHPSPAPIWNTLMVPNCTAWLSGPCSYPWINRAQVAQGICFRKPKERGHLWKQATVPTTHARSN